jgi:hypothetical protein
MVLKVKRRLMIADIIAIAILCCFVINSGAVDSLKRALWRWLKGNVPYRDFPLKPFDCELCLTWWSGVLYLLFSGNLSLLALLYVALVAWCTPVIVELLNLLVDIPRWLIDLARNKLKL